MLDPCWGYVELCENHVGSCSVKIGARLAHLGAIWLYVGPFLKFCWGYVGSSGLYVGAKFAHLELCWSKKLSPVPCESYSLNCNRPMLDAPRVQLNRFGVMKKTSLKKRSPQWPARSQYDPCEAFFLQNLAPAWDGHCENAPLLAHLGAMLGLCWPIWGLCWGHVRPSWGYVGAMLTPRR